MEMGTLSPGSQTVLRMSCVQGSFRMKPNSFEPHSVLMNYNWRDSHLWVHCMKLFLYFPSILLIHIHRIQLQLLGLFSNRWVLYDNCCNALDFIHFISTVAMVVD